MIIGKMQAVPAEMILPEGILNFDSSTTLIPVELNGTHFTTGGNYEGAKIIPISTPRIITPRTQSVTVLELGKRLLQSARDGNTEEVRDLMGKGAPFSTDWLGTSPLHLAAMGNHVKTCEVLLRAGICKDARTKVDRTPLHIAAYEGHSEIVELLLVNGADVNSRDMLKMTPLHWAVQEEHKDCIKLLLQYGASIDVVSKFDKSPMGMAIEQDRTDLAQMMHVAQKLIAERLQNLELQQATLMATQSLTDQLSGTSTDNKNDETSPDDDTSNDQLDKMEMLEEDESNINLCTNITNDLVEEKSECNGKSTQSNKIISANESIKILQAHGITIFPKNEMSVVQTATENGQTVVLTDGGKFSISNQKAVSSINNSGSQNTNNTNEQKGVLSPFKLKERKVIRLRSDQFLALANGRLPNLFKKVIPLSTNNSSATIKPVKRIVMTKNRFMVSPKLQTNVAAKMETVDSITKKLMDARRFIVEYRQKLKEKEDEVQQYENILQKLRAIKK